MTFLGYQPTKRDLQMVRGDDAASIVIAHTLAPSSASDFTEVRFTVRDRIDGDIVFALTKTTNAARFAFGSGTITITPVSGDTDGKLYGRHVYDVEATPSSGTYSGKVITVQSGGFHLIGDVSSGAVSGEVIPTSQITYMMAFWTVALSRFAGAPTMDGTYPQVISSVDVTWPDGYAGEYTATTIDATWQEATAWTLTHATYGRTLTFTGFVRDANGVITNPGSFSIS